MPKPIQTPSVTTIYWVLLLPVALLATDEHWMLYPAVHILAVFGVLLGLQSRHSLPDFRSSSVLAPLAMVGGFVLVSLLWSPVVSISLFECQAFVLLCASAVYFSGLRTGDAIKLYYWSMPLFLGMAFWGLYQRFHDGHLAQALFNDPNLFAGLMLSAVPVAMGMLWDAQKLLTARYHKPLLAAVTVAGVLAVYFARSRGATLAIIVSCVFTYVITGRKHRPSRRVLGALVLGLVALAGASILAKTSPSTVSAANAGVKTQVGDKSAQSRAAMLRATVEMVKDNPLKGVGFGLWHVAYPHYRTDADVDSAGYRAHNDYLEALATGGPLALMGILVIPGLWLLALLRARRMSEKPTAVFYGVAVGLGTLCAQASVNFVFHQSGVCLWAGALIGGLYCLTGGKPGKPTGKSVRGGGLVLATVTSVVAVLGYISMTPTLVLGAPQSFEAKHLKTVLTDPALEVLANVYPFSSNAYFALGARAHLVATETSDSRLRRAKLKQAFNYYSLAEKREPAQATLYLRKAFVMAQYPGLPDHVRTSELSKYYQQALALDPSMYLAVEEYSKLLVQEGDLTGARAVVSRALQATPELRRRPLKILQSALAVRAN